MNSNLERGKEREYGHHFALTLMKMGFPIRTLDGNLKLEYRDPFANTVSTLDGVPVPEWQVQMMGAQWPTQHSVKWADFASLLTEIFGTSGVDWEKHLKLVTVPPYNPGWENEHRGQFGTLSKEDSVSAAQWRQAFYDLQPKDGYFYAQEDLSVIQAYILLKSLATEVLRQGRKGAATPAAGMGTDSLVNLAAAKRKGPCVFTPKEEVIVGGGEKYVKTFQTGVVKYLVQAGVLAENASRYLGIANILSNAAEALVALLVLQVRMDIDKKPLLRTTNSVANEEATVSLTAAYEPDWQSMSNCFRLALAVAGVNGVTVPSGPAQVSFVPVGRQGFNELCALHVVGLRDGGKVLHTDDQGRANVRVVGAPNIPPVIGNIEYTFPTASLGLVMSGQDNSLVKDLLQAGGTAVSGPGALPQGMIGVFSKLRVVTYYFQFVVKDPYVKSDGPGSAGGGGAGC